MRLAVLALGVVALVVVAVARAAPADASSTGGYQPPVSAPVSDPFRPPSSQYGAGNRGLDYATAHGTDVKAAADGEVVFAGQVGGTLHVVVLHGDGIRTSYSYLSSIRVQRGDRVRQGQVVGTTGQQPFHFGARAGDAYIDPALLFSTGPPQVHLVPDSERRPQTEAHERSGLLGMLAGLPGHAFGATADAVGWAASAAGDTASAPLSALGKQVTTGVESLRAAAERCIVQLPPVQAFRVANAVASVFDQGDCTPADVTPPKVRGHIAVLVGGLGSQGDADGQGAAIYRVDTAALGYAKDDVYRFSYRGGTAADHPYGKADTEVDIRASGARLRALLEQLQYDHPGVTVDILAHSQEGSSPAPRWRRATTAATRDCRSWAPSSRWHRLIEEPTVPRRPRPFAATRLLTWSYGRSMPHCRTRTTRVPRQSRRCRRRRRSSPTSTSFRCRRTCG